MGPHVNVIGKTIYKLSCSSTLWAERPLRTPVQNEVSSQIKWKNCACIAHLHDRKLVAVYPQYMKVMEEVVNGKLSNTHVNFSIPWNTGCLLPKMWHRCHMEWWSIQCIIYRLRYYNLIRGSPIIWSYVVSPPQPTPHLQQPSFAAWLVAHCTLAVHCKC